MSIQEGHRFWSNAYRAKYSKARRAQAVLGAIDSGQTVLLRRLLNAGLRQKDLDCGLVHAARHGSLTSLELMESFGANPKANNSETLYWAGLRNYPVLAERLIARGASLADRCDILCAAISSASVEAVDVFLTHGAEIHARVSMYDGMRAEGDSALWTAFSGFEKAKESAARVKDDLSVASYADICVQKQKAMAGILCLLAAAEPDESRWTSDEARAVVRKFSEGQDDFIKTWREQKAFFALKKPVAQQRITLPTFSF